MNRKAKRAGQSPQIRVAVVYDCVFPVSTGGGERVYCRMAEELVGRGARVSYVTRTEQARGAPHMPFDLVPVWSGEIYDSFGTRTASSAVRFAWHVFGHFRGRTSYDLAIVSALPVLNVLAARFGLLGKNTRLVVDWLEVWTLGQWIRYAGRLQGTIAFVLQLVAVRMGWLHTVNSSFTAERVRRYRPSRAVLVLGLVDLARLPSRPANTKRAMPFGVFVGRHIEDKRVTAIPAATARVVRKVPEFRFVIAGTGPETDEVRRLIAQYGMEGTVDTVGRISDEELARLLSEASVLVNPSAREGFGLTVAEAAAYGTPSVVVAGAGNAAAELVEQGINGVVAPSAAPVDLADAIVGVLELGEPLRQRTREWFEDRRLAANLASSVDEILERLSASTHAL